MDSAATLLRLAACRRVWLGGTVVLFLTHAALAKEYFIGRQMHERDIQIFANYLIGADPAPLPPNTPTGPDVIHLEADIHATGYNRHGFADGAWIPYLKVQYTLEKRDSGWKASGELRAMTAQDGPHYGNNVRMDGPGTYDLVYRISPPDVNGFLRHTDPPTGVPEWWKPFSVEFEFTYPKE